MAGQGLTLGGIRDRNSYRFKLFKHDCGLGLVQIHFKIGVGDGILIHLGNPIHLQIAFRFESGLCWSISPLIRSFSVRLVLYGYRDMSFGLGLAQFRAICLPFCCFSTIHEWLNDLNSWASVAIQE